MDALSEIVRFGPRQSSRRQRSLWIALWSLVVVLSSGFYIFALAPDPRPGRLASTELLFNLRSSGLGPATLRQAGPTLFPRGLEAPFAGQDPTSASAVFTLQGATFWLSQCAIALLFAMASGILASVALRRLGLRFHRARIIAGFFAWLMLAQFLAASLLLWLPIPAFWIPTTAFVVALAIQLGSRPAQIATLLLSVSAALLIPPFDPRIAATLAAQGLAVAWCLPTTGSPKVPRVMRLCGLSALLGALTYAASSYLFWGAQLLTPQKPSPALLWGDLGGVIMASALWPWVGLAIHPILERILGHLSRNRLLELSDLRHPLLQRIAKRAPGTWSHSRMMANLAESAAHAVGADALLVRVGAYFHDLGKADEPYFFIENIGTGKSGHEKLSPQQSAKKIIQHVSAGVKRGRQAGLPEEILDFMHSHHGNGRVEYFYQQALREAKERAQAEGAKHYRVDTKDFCYPGKAPQSAETAILAIVDAVEAAARTLRQPTPESIDTLIRQIIFSKLSAGQLDDSGLTPKDLRKMAENLRESLLASAHERILYPWQEGKTPDTTDNINAQDAKLAVHPSKAPTGRKNPSTSPRLTAVPTPLKPSGLDPSPTPPDEPPDPLPFRPKD